MKKIFSLILALVMAAGLLPGTIMPVASAAPPTGSIIQDPNFYAGVLTIIGEADGYVITADDVKSITDLVVSDFGIKSLSGIEHFTALESLWCTGNQLKSLDLSQNTALDQLDCRYNQLTTLDLSENTALTDLYCSYNQLTTLDVSKNTALDRLYCNDNQLTTLDVSENIALTVLQCNDNQLTALDVSKNIALTDIYCDNNELTSLDLSNNTALKILHCYGNLMGTNPDISVIGWKNYFSTAGSYDGTGLTIPFKYFPQGDPGTGINHAIAPVTISGTGAAGFSIDLTQETIATGYDVKAFSTDGGATWKAAKSDTFSAEKFSKLFNKDLNLQLSDKDIDRTTKKPAEGAVIVYFPKINKRPTTPKLAINYLIAADPTGNTPGEWVLAEKNGTTAVKTDILIGVADGKDVDGDDWGKFFDGAATGIPVKASGGKTAYYFKSAAVKVSDAEYTPASKQKKVSAVSLTKAPTYKLDTKKKLIKYKANTYIKAGDAAPVLKSEKGEVTNAGTYTFWLGATAKKPASVKQTPLTVAGFFAV